MQELLAKLSALVDGDVLSDKVTRLLYATDASPYQVLPLAVLRPKHKQDCRVMMKFASEHQLPLISRAAGTSLAGQCVGDGLILDMTFYMHDIINIDVEQRCVTVQPGVVRNELNTELCSSALMFAPDPSTSDYCTVGGMVGNNAWGIHSLRYGACRENINAMEVVLSDGSLALFEALDSQALSQKLDLPCLEGDIYRAVFKAVEQHQQLIAEGFAQPDGIVRNSAYALDVLLAGLPWQPDGAKFNLAPFMCGSEGTLVLMTELQLKLVPLVDKPFLLALHFSSLDTALKAVPACLQFKPAAMELVDKNILQQSKANLNQQANRFWLKGDPAAVLLLEFHADTLRSIDQSASSIEAMRQQVRADHISLVTEHKINQVWALRKAGLGLLMGQPGLNKAVTGIEDAAVSVSDLAAYVREVQQLLAGFATDCVVYGPVGRGTVHLRPQLNLNEQTDREKYALILQAVCDLVIRFGGVISAKHGDGRLRGYYLQQQFGPQLYAVLRDIKCVFDPLGILNPHKIFAAKEPLTDLRFSGEQDSAAVKNYFDWSKDAGIFAASQKCNGAAVCLQGSGQGGMCPSYQATREERHGTRGRANLFRQLLSAKGVNAALTHHDMKALLDLCLACKACKSECPANVDMAQLKAEFLQHYNDHHGASLRAQMFAGFDIVSRYASLLPALSNRLLKQSWFKKTLGLHEQRNLPEFAPLPFSCVFAQQKHHDNAGKGAQVLLIVDPYSEYFEPAIAQAACAVLQHLQCSVTLTPCLGMGRAQISQGFLRRAKKRLGKAIESLLPYAEAGIPMISLEPSELSCLRDEAGLLLKDEKLIKQLQQILQHTASFEEFMLQQDLASNFPASSVNKQQYLVHTHCHQKALQFMSATTQLLNVLPGAEVSLVNSGCCGMAGAFGYEAEHYQTSLDIAELALFPAIRQAKKETLLVASGYSCRHQISTALGMRAYHPAEVLALALQLL